MASEHQRSEVPIRCDSRPSAARASHARRRRAGRVRLAAALTLVVLPLAGCGLFGSSGDPSKSAGGPFAADIALAKENATSDFERAVLADGVITAAEYEEAIQAYLTCMNAGLPEKFAPGLTGVKDELGRYTYSSPRLTETDLDEFNALTEKRQNDCERGTSLEIEGLYNDMIANPNKTDRYTQAVICLKRFKLVPDSYAVKNFLADGAAHGEGPNPNGGPAYDPADATDIAWDSDGVVKCRLNPWME